MTNTSCRCAKLSDLGIQHIARGCVNLESLSLAYCEGVGTQGLIGIAEGCPKLRTLDVTGLIKLHDPGIQAIMKVRISLSGNQTNGRLLCACL